MVLWKTHPRPSRAPPCFLWTRWDIVEEEKLQQFPAGGIWTQRIKNFGCSQLWPVGIFQWEGLLHPCYAGELPFIPHLRGIFWRVFFKKWPWTGATGTESPVCPQQHSLIRCNTLISWKDALNSCKVRVILISWYASKGLIQINSVIVHYSVGAGEQRCR